MVIMLISVVAWAVPVRLWVEAISADVRIGIGHLIGMRLRKVNPPAVVRPLIWATKAGLRLSADELEAHYLAGGQVDRVVRALISADKANIEMGFQQAAAIDLAGRDVFEAVQVSVIPKVINTPKVAAMAKDGIQLIAQARVTVRANINRLVGGAGEDTILARVGEGIVSSIGSATSHTRKFSRTRMPSRRRFWPKGSTPVRPSRSFRSTSPMSTSGRTLVPIFRHIRPTPTNAWPRPAPRSGARWPSLQEQEMKARVEEMRADLVKAESEVPLALAEAFREGHMGVMDYVRYNNIQSDTSMRKAIASSDEPDPEPLA